MADLGSESPLAEAVEKLAGYMMRLDQLREAGLPAQSAQALLRLHAAAVPRHVLRAQLCSEAAVDAYD
eukprot:6350313-Alexandrium_andersonii.AAC.1